MTSTVLLKHWPEYLVEATSTALLLVSVCLAKIFVYHPLSPAKTFIGDAPLLGRIVVGLWLGITVMALVYSYLGRRSGAHFNPAVTLTYFRLGKIRPWDTLFYMLFQFLGATTGTLLVAVLGGNWLATHEVNFAVTTPGNAGYFLAFAAEVGMSFSLMLIILMVSNSHRLKRFTGVFVAIAFVIYMTIESPISGMSMNPARSFGTAFVANSWHALWIYLLAPTVGMFLAAESYLWTRGADAIHCAKLNHSADVRCIFKCGYALEK